MLTSSFTVFTRMWALAASDPQAAPSFLSESQRSNEGARLALTFTERLIEAGRRDDRENADFEREMFREQREMQRQEQEAREARESRDREERRQQEERERQEQDRHRPDGHESSRGGRDFSNGGYAGPDHFDSHTA